MRDSYEDGYNDGYGNRTYGKREYPKTDQDDYSYRQGIDDGRRRRQISDELERDGY